ncbi:MAG TPA: MlaD family protein [Bryobacteraceae bacterium]|nr:MlaD family protein [Bryobacteraceae bacterium]
MSVEAKVGTFVIVCLLLLGVTVYYVGNDQWGAHLTPYKTYLRYAGGVAPGTEVLFGGIQAGRVTDVKPSSADPTRIEILLEVKAGTPVNENSTAKLGSVSLMSSPAVSITTGTNDARRLKAGQVIRSEETVSIDDMTRKLSGIADSAEGLITQVQGELKNITGDARKLLANLNDVTGPPNRREVAQLLQHVNSLVATQSPKIDALTEQLLVVSRNADSVVKKIGPLVDHTDATVSNVNLTIDQLRDPIRQDLTQLQSTMAQAKSMMATIQTLVRANDPNISETVENLRVATENIDQLTDQVKQRPWSLVRIRQPKDRKLPQ